MLLHGGLRSSQVCRHCLPALLALYPPRLATLTSAHALFRATRVRATRASPQCSNQFSDTFSPVQAHKEHERLLRPPSVPSASPLLIASRRGGPTPLDPDGLDGSDSFDYAPCPRFLPHPAPPSRPCQIRASDTIFSPSVVSSCHAASGI